MDRLLFLGKANDYHTMGAWDLCNQEFEAVGFFGDWGDPWPEALSYWEGDYIISYLSRWIIPGDVLSKARKAALNFHPAPPEYPGYGPVNWALYDGVDEYGVTCHHMDPNVDSGKIIKVMRFPVLNTDNVERLLYRAHSWQAELFEDIMALIVKGQPLPVSSEQWRGRKRTKKQLDRLATLTPEMNRCEMERRIRATSYQDWQPYLQINGTKYRLVSDGN